jgi:excisionase family DNA binding protein
LLAGGDFLCAELSTVGLNYTKVEVIKMRRLLKIYQAAEIMDVPVERAYALARDGILPVVHLGRQIRIAPEQFEEWIKNGGQALPGGWKYDKE